MSVSVTDVQNMLSLSTNNISELVDATVVNKFSKYKPVEYNTVNSLTESDFSLLNYGLTIQEMSDVKNTQGKQWLYSRPTTAKRLGDFEYYYHNAPTALLQSKGVNWTYNKFSGVGGSIGFLINQAPFGYETNVLNISNITPENGSGVLLNNYWLGAAIYQSTTLKGNYYSYAKINYNNIDANGATIVFDNSVAFNSADGYLINYAAGSYTVYLYITDYDVNIPIGGIRKYYPINYSSLFPQTINLTVQSVAETFEVDILGITPYPNEIWADSTTGYYDGTVSQSKRGTFYRFKVKLRIYNKTSSTVYLPLSNCFLFYNYITTWGGTVNRTSKVIGSGTQSIAGNSYIDIVVDYISPLPATVVNADGSLTLNFHLHYTNSDSGEQFTEINTNSIILQYND